MVIFYFLDNHSGCRSVEDGSPRKLDLGDHDPQGNNSLEHSAKTSTHLGVTCFTSQPSRTSSSAEPNSFLPTVRSSGNDLGPSLCF